MFIHANSQSLQFRRADNNAGTTLYNIVNYLYFLKMYFCRKEYSLKNCTLCNNSVENNSLLVEVQRNIKGLHNNRCCVLVVKVPYFISNEESTL